MIDIEKYMGSFKESITKRLDRHEENLKNFSDKMKSFEITQREYKRRLNRLEDGRDPDKNEDIELKHVKNFLSLLFLICFCFYKNLKFLGAMQIRKIL
jgi:hypothetical protein